MSFVRTLEDFRPPWRADEISFVQARIQESTLEDGPYTTIETKTFDADADPAVPRSHDFTTNDATHEVAYYRVVWVDSEGATFTGAPVFYDANGVADPLDIDWRPSVLDVAQLLRGRSYDSNSSQVGTFNSTTRPTSDQVEELITKGTTFVAAATGRTEFATDATKLMAKDLATVRAAMLVELSYTPEQATADDTAYERLNDLVQQGMRELVEAIGDTDGTRKGFYSIPMRSELADYFA